MTVGGECWFRSDRAGQINSCMKTITIPTAATRNQRDALIARVIRHLARIQRKVERMQAADEPSKGPQAKPAC